MKNSWLRKISLAMSLVLLGSMSSATFAGTNPKSPARTAVATVAAEDAMAYLPDSQGIAVLNLQQIYGSFVMKMAKDNPDFKKGLDEVESAARVYGIEPSQMEYLIVGMPDDPNALKGSSPKVPVIISGSFNQDQLLTALKASPDKLEVKSEAYGNETVYMINPVAGASGGNATKPKVLTNDDFKANSSKSASSKVGSDPVALAFLNSHAAAIGDRDSVLRVLDTKAGKIPSVTSNKKLVAAFQETDSSAHIRFASAIPASLRKEMEADINKNQQMGQMFKPFLAITTAFGSLDLSSGLKLLTTLRANTESEAKPIFEQLNGLLAMGKFALNSSEKKQEKELAELLNGISINQKATDVQLNIAIPESVFKTLTEGKQKHESEAK
ncbi:MAG: hypothetical protein K1Y36_27835 [Blastocatellia bacterium]|nr:hypothetical protein [Blastocatellia bacterium]